MNARNLWIAALCGAAATTLLANTPVVAFVNLLLCSGFWGGAVSAVWIYRRRSGSLTVGQGVAVGVLTGALAGAFGFALSFLGLAGLQGIFNQIRLFTGPDAGSLEYSIAEALAFNTVGVMINIIFGTVGGLIGGALLQTGNAPAAEAA